VYRKDEGKVQSQNDWKKITRYLSGECSEPEKEEIQAMIKSDESFAKLIQEMRQILSVKQKPIPVKDVEAMWREIKADILQTLPATSREPGQDYPRKLFVAKNITSASWKILRYAAVVILAVGLSYYAMKSIIPSILQQPQREYRVLTVNHGERLTITLTDGTSITLDAGSELKYKTEFSNSREVYLKGEGYFQVAHDSKHPFYVHANHALVQVLGTKFNVRTWDENPLVTVTVKEGKVALGYDDPHASARVLLNPGQQSSLPRHGRPSQPVSVDADEYTLWMHNEIHFQDATLKEIFAQLERWYDFQFEVEDDLLQTSHLTVHIKRSNVDNVIELISIITKTEIVREGKKIRLVPKKNS